VVKTDQGTIDAVKLNISYCHLRAPISGRIGLRLIDPGNIVRSTDSTGLLVITELQPISVIFTMAEDQLTSVVRRVRAGARLRVDAYDRDNKVKLATGVLTTIDNQIDQTTGTLKLRAVFPNSSSELFPNQFVNARLLVEQKNAVTLVPTAAVQRNTQMTYVWMVKPDSSVTVQKIEIGASEGPDTEVKSGLEPGVSVVMTGVDKLSEGGKVRAQADIQGGGGGREGGKQGREGGKQGREGGAKRPRQAQ
jgi:multidrug efflux system membrane fusion protein